MVDRTAKPGRAFSVTPPFREGQSARPLAVGCGVSRRMGRLWIETWDAASTSRAPAGGAAQKKGCEKILRESDFFP